MSNIFQLTPGRMIITSVFDSENLHIRKNAGTDQMPVVMTQTVFPGVNGGDDYYRPIYSIYAGAGNKQYSMKNIWAGVLSSVTEKPATLTVGV